jgi:hypothetical protein
MRHGETWEIKTCFVPSYFIAEKTSELWEVLVSTKFAVKAIYIRLINTICILNSRRESDTYALMYVSNFVMFSSVSVG